MLDATQSYRIKIKTYNNYLQSILVFECCFASNYYQKASEALSGGHKFQILHVHGWRNGGGAKPLIFPMYLLLIYFKKPQTTVRRPQKHSLEVKNSKFPWGSMPPGPDPPRELMVLILKPEPPHYCRVFSALDVKKLGSKWGQGYYAYVQYGAKGDKDRYVKCGLIMD